MLDGNCKDENQIDMAFLIGVHSIFDEFETCFNNLIKWTKPGGRVYIVGLFNPSPVDVMIKYKESKDYKSNMYESGWNVFSQKSVSEFLQMNNKVQSFSFKKFEIDIDIPAQKDPIRSWTILDENKKRLIVNGLCLLQPFYLLEIKL